MIPFVNQIDKTTDQIRLELSALDNAFSKGGHGPQCCNDHAMAISSTEPLIWIFFLKCKRIRRDMKNKGQENGCNGTGVGECPLC